jgi:hypothetical protein
MCGVSNAVDAWREEGVVAERQREERKKGDGHSNRR